MSVGWNHNMISSDEFDEIHLLRSPRSKDLEVHPNIEDIFIELNNRSPNINFVRINDIKNVKELDREGLYVDPIQIANAVNCRLIPVEASKFNKFGKLVTYPVLLPENLEFYNTLPINNVIYQAPREDIHYTFGKRHSGALLEVACNMGDITVVQFWMMLQSHSLTFCPDRSIKTPWKKCKMNCNGCAQNSYLNFHGFTNASMSATLAYVMSQYVANVDLSNTSMTTKISQLLNKNDLPSILNFNIGRNSSVLLPHIMSCLKEYIRLGPDNLVISDIWEKCLVGQGDTNGFGQSRKVISNIRHGNNDWPTLSLETNINTSCQYRLDVGEMSLKGFLLLRAIFGAYGYEHGVWLDSNIYERRLREIGNTSYGEDAFLEELHNEYKGEMWQKQVVKAVARPSSWNISDDEESQDEDRW